MSTVQASDVMPVRSRVSWGAIMAGAFIAMAVYLLLGTLGVAIGISAAPRAEGETLATGAGIWAAVTMLISLFIGGCVSSRCTAGESKTEAMMYGVVVWGVFLFAMMVFAAGVAGTGLRTVVGLGNAAATASGGQLTTERLREAGFSQAQIRDMRAEFNNLQASLSNLPEAAREAANDPRTAAAAWWTFGGLLLSIGAAVGGALVGAGPDVFASFIRVRTTGTITEGTPHGGAVPR